VVYWRVHALYLSAGKSYQCLSSSVVSGDGKLCSRLIPECAVSHVTSVLAMHVSCIVLGTLRTTMTCASFFVVQFNGFMIFTI